MSAFRLDFYVAHILIRYIISYMGILAMSIIYGTQNTSIQIRVNKYSHSLTLIPLLPSLIAKQKQKKSSAPKTIWTIEEVAVLRKHRDAWLELENRAERDALVNGTVAEEIRSLNPDVYGIQAIGRNKKAKEEWDRRCRVSFPVFLLSLPHSTSYCWVPGN